MARSRDSVTKPTFLYSLVNELGGAFHIDNHTGQIVVANVAGKTGTFQLKAKVTDENGFSAQTVVQIQVESPSSSSDVSEIKINQTSDDVKLHMKKIIRALEKVLQNKVTNITLDSDASKKQDTDIKFKVAGESSQDIDRKLTDNLSKIQEQLASIFGKPTDIAVSQPHNFDLFKNVKEVAGAVTFAVITAAVIAAAAFILKRKRSKRSSSEFIDEPNSAGGGDEDSNSILKEENGDKKTDINGDQCEVSQLSGTQSKENEDITGEENREKKPQFDISKLSGTQSKNGKHEDISGEENKSTDKAEETSPKQQMNPTVTDTQEQTDQNPLPTDGKPSQERSKRSKNELLDKFFPASDDPPGSSNIVRQENGSREPLSGAGQGKEERAADDVTLEDSQKKPNMDADQYDVSKRSETEGENKKDEDISGEENKSTDKAEETSPKQQMDQTVTDTQEQTDQNPLPDKDWKPTQKRSKRSRNELLDKYFPASGDAPGSSNIVKEENGSRDPLSGAGQREEERAADDVTLEDSQKKTNMDADQYDVSKLSETQGKNEKDEDIPGEENKSTVPTENEILDVEISETVDYTVEPSDGNSESEPSIHEVVTITEEATIEEDGKDIQITEEKEIEFVETWESYESSEGSDMDSTKNDEIKQENPESPDDDDVVIIQANEQPQSDNEKMTCAATPLHDE